MAQFKYVVYRHDWSAQTSSLSRSGDVLKAVRSSLPSKPILVRNNHIALFVHTQLANQYNIISSVCIQNRSNENTSNKYFYFVESVCYIKYPNTIFTLLGDYNLS